MIFLLLGLELTELETHFLKLAREKAPHQKRFSQLLHQAELSPGKISTVRFSITKLAVPGETRTARGDQETSARARVYEGAGAEARRTPLGPCREGEEEPGTLAARSEARELRVNEK